MYYFEELKKNYSDSESKFKRAFEKDYLRIKQLYNALVDLAQTYTTLRLMLGFKLKDPTILYATVGKSLSNLFPIIHLTFSEQCGSGRIIMRNVFEYLVVGKYLAKIDDPQVMEDWQNGEIINLDKRIFNRMVDQKAKGLENIRHFWSDLSKCSHATRDTGQIIYEDDDKEKVSNFYINISFIYILIFMIYHFMNSIYATSYMKSYVKDSRNSADVWQETYDSNEFIKSTLSSDSGFKFTQNTINIIDFYASKWKIKVPKNNNNSNNDDVPKSIFKAKRNHELDLLKGSEIQTRQELLQYLNGLVTDYRNRDSNQGYCKVVAKHCHRLIKMVKQINPKSLRNTNLFYKVVIENDRVNILLMKQFPYDQSRMIKPIATSYARYISIEDFSIQYAVHTSTVYRWIREDKLENLIRIDNKIYISELEKRPTKYK